MNLLPGLKNSLILDDSYNASPESMRAAIEVLASLPATRRIAVLGDMLEIGKYALQAHEAVAGQLAGKIDVLVTVGLRGKLIADAMFQSKTISRKNIYSFGSAEEAQNVVFGLLQEGDLVLVKASRGIGLDAVVKAICSFE
jgi:UDP-N-acetylmuramoyl-tripeptide--D-alanyl-D-alanine ligase